MKLVRHGEKGREKPGIVDGEGVVRNLSGVVKDIGGEVLGDEGLAKLRAMNVMNLPKVEGDYRLGACVGGVGKFLCIGLNYEDHAKESGLRLPEEPVLFQKALSSLSGAYDDIELPRGSVKTDWEVELGVVIGKEGKYIEERDALLHVAGYCTVNDVSERDFQIRRSGQWTKGKSADSFGPIGPWLVTRDEVEDTQDLSLYCEVNGRRYQDGHTRHMHFGVAYVVSYLSQFMSLQAGDVIATGTPSGVGHGQKPPVFLKVGDEVRLGVEGLGEQRHKVVSFY